MSEVLTAAQMRALEMDAIQAGAVTGLELMERAGRGVVDAILEWRPELSTAPQRAVILCGPGNNGGDGFVIARLLHELGWDVRVHLFGDEARLPPDAAKNAASWRALGAIHPFAELQYPGRDALLIDALFGTGLSRPLPGEVVQKISDEDLFTLPQNSVVAVDAPSGLCMDSGRVLGGGAPFWLDVGLTVTFHKAKCGHHLAMGPVFCGQLKVVDIGLEDGLLQTGWTRLLSRQIGPSTRWGNQPGIAQKRWGHKYDHGHALILSGGAGKAGAARLAARGALRTGAGLVTVACPAASLAENAARLDAVMLAAVDDGETLRRMLVDRKITAACVGPGFGTGKWLREVVSILLDAQVPTILDADALTEYRPDPDAFFSMLHRKCVLTPHQGEFGRLFPDILQKTEGVADRGPAYSKVDATRDAAGRAGCSVLFKGPDTVIAAPDGRSSINSAHYERATPWLATAGSGDVLAGFIAGLLARGAEPHEASETGAWLHVECARSFGPGLIAEDLADQLPVVFRDLGL